MMRWSSSSEGVGALEQRLDIEQHRVRVAIRPRVGVRQPPLLPSASSMFEQTETSLCGVSLWSLYRVSTCLIIISASIPKVVPTGVPILGTSGTSGTAPLAKVAA